MDLEDAMLVPLARRISSTWINESEFLLYIFDALWDLVPFAQFKKREKHSWRSVTFSKVAGWSLKPATLLKGTLLRGCFLGIFWNLWILNIFMERPFSIFGSESSSKFSAPLSLYYFGGSKGVSDDTIPLIFL